MNTTATMTSESACVDQAIFTSVRSPTGAGYRIIAASPAVNRQEKAEIIRRAPSHASLDRPDPDAAALLAFPIGTDRYCVGLSQHAGKEHTARGGERVYTHFVILNRQDYELFGTHPLTVQTALSTAVGGAPQLKPPPSLEQLTLRTPPKPMRVQNCHIAPYCNVPAVLRICQAMLQGEKLLVTDPVEGCHLLDQTMTCLPAAVRRGLAVSIGLKFSPGRRLQLCIVRQGESQTRMAPSGMKARLLDAANPPNRTQSRYDAWLDLIEHHLESGRMMEMRHLTAEMTEDACPESLTRIATLCFDIDAVAKAQPNELDRLLARHSQTPATQPAEARLLRQFHEAAEQRANAFQKPHN